MSKIEIVCCPPDLAAPVIRGCESTIMKGLAVCPEIDRAELLDRLTNKSALMWMVLRDTKDCLAIGFTELVPEEDAVAVFGLAGRNMWRWSKQFAEVITEYARTEGVQRVLFAGSHAYRRLIPGAQVYGERDGQTVFERRTLQ